MLCFLRSIRLSKVQSHVLVTNWLYLKALAPELGLHVCVHPKLILIGVSIACRNGRVMADLFTKVLEVWIHQFESLTKNRVEGFV